MNIFGQLKQVGHRDITHAHHVWDRAMFGACREHIAVAESVADPPQCHPEGSSGFFGAQIMVYVCVVCKPRDTRFMQCSALEYCSDTIVVWLLLIIFESLRKG